MKLDIEALAKEAGFTPGEGAQEGLVFTESEDEISAELIRFAELVEAVTREDCALIAESDDFYGSATQHNIAAAIRALK